MKSKVVFVFYLIFVIISVVASIFSFVCFSIFDRTEAVVVKVDRNTEETYVQLNYHVNKREYIKVQRYKVGKQIKTGDTITVWYHQSNPGKSLSFHDFLPYYLATIIMGVPLSIPYIFKLIQMIGTMKHKKNAVNE